MQRTIKRSLAALGPMAAAALLGGAAWGGGPGRAERPPAPISAPASQAAQAGGLSLRVDSVDWMEHEHTVQGPTGFPMAASMMPGMPAADHRRLHLELTLYNSGQASQSFRPEELRLGSARGASWPAVGGSLRAATLGPRQALNGALFFDLPEAASGLHLAWTRGGRKLQIPVADKAPDPSHHESPGHRHDKAPGHNHERSK